MPYWREQPLEVDGIIERGWGAWAIEVKTGDFQPSDLLAPLGFVRRDPRFRPLVIRGESGVAAAERAGVESILWTDFLVRGPSALPA